MQKEFAEKALEMRRRRLLAPPAAAEYLGVVKGTLAKWRHFGEGPAYIKLGTKILYEQDVLDDCLDKHRRISTSEAA